MKTIPNEEKQRILLEAEKAGATGLCAMSAKDTNTYKHLVTHGCLSQGPVGGFFRITPRGLSEIDRKLRWPGVRPPGATVLLVCDTCGYCVWKQTRPVFCACETDIRQAMPEETAAAIAYADEMADVHRFNNLSTR